MSRRAVLAAVRDLTAEAGWPPSQREIAARVSLSVATVNHHLASLAADGLVRKGAGPRQIRAAGAFPAVTCRKCGRVFHTARKNAVYCSDSCRAQAWKRDHKKSPALTGTGLPPTNRTLV